MEITLYDKNGSPVAYVADDEKSIYLWSGHAVAYIYSNKVYGWNGKHLGWFFNGVIYDSRGLRIGFIRSQCPSATYAEPAKYAKFAKHAKYARYASYAKPALCTGYSSQDLREFLEEGKVG